MNEIPEMGDRELLAVLHDSGSRVRLSVRPPLETIVARGRVYRRHRLTRGVGSALAVTAAIAVAIPAYLTAGSGHPAARVAEPVKVGSGPVHVVLSAFSVNTNPNNTVTVTITPAQALDPSTFRQIMAEAGVPAIINVGTLCRTANTQHVSAGGAMQLEPQPGGDLTVVINPALVPAGIEYSFGYFSDHVAVAPVEIGQPLSCGASSGAPPIPAPSSGTGGQSVSS